MVSPRVVTGVSGSKEEAEMREYLVPFTAAFVLCAVTFLGMDTAIMTLQGLSLIFRP